MTRRLLVALVLLPLFTACLYLGSTWLFLVTAAFCSLAFVEFCDLFKGLAPPKAAGAVLVVLVVAAMWAGLPLPAAALPALLLPLHLLAKRPASGTLTALAGVVYVGLLGGTVLPLRESGFAVALLPFVAVWASDTAAFFVGRAVGGPKVFPFVSPAKTYSGTLGGLAFAAVVTAFLPLPVPLYVRVAAGLLCAAAGVAGDLFESSLKRDAKVKDSGSALLDHGGFLDRVDGLLFAVPLFTLLAPWILTTFRTS